MMFSEGAEGRNGEIVRLFETTFADSEGEAEGSAIGELARQLLSQTPERDLYCFLAEEDGRLVGAVAFSRMVFDGDDRTAFLLSPMAIVTDRHGEGIGQRLIAHGLAALRERAVDVVFTYGDPDFYSRAGFRQITGDFAAPPYPLGQPHGWQATALQGEELTPLRGASRCVSAFADPAYW